MLIKDTIVYGQIFGKGPGIRWPLAKIRRHVLLAQPCPQVTSMVSDEDVELRTTELGPLWCMILQKPPVDRSWYLPGGTLLPELSGETERTAGIPAVAGEFEFACGGGCSSANTLRI
jgi:hypothetical protein